LGIIFLKNWRLVRRIWILKGQRGLKRGLKGRNFWVIYWKLPIGFKGRKEIRAFNQLGKGLGGIKKGPVGGKVPPYF